MSTSSFERARSGALLPFPNRAALAAAFPAAENPMRTELVGGAAPYEIRQSNGKYWATIHTPFTPTVRAVATNGAFPNNFATASKQIQTIRRHTITSRTTTLRARLVNKYVDPADWTEKSPGAASTVTMGLIKGGVNLGSFKSGGNATMTVADGGTLDTDDFTGLDLYAGDVVYTVTFLTNTAGIVYEGNTVTSTRPVYWDNPNGEVCQVSAASLTDQTTTSTGTLTGGSFTGAHGGPFALMASSTDPAVMILGDSIEVGIGEAFVNVPAARGVYARALNHKVAYSKVATGGDGAVKFVASHAVRAAMKDIFTHVWCNYGINDLTNFSRTPANVVADLQTIAGYFSGMPFDWRTMLPDAASSTDAYMTTGGQTIHSQAASIVSLNNLMRAKPAGITNIYETANVVSAGPDTNKWRANGYIPRLNTADGLHPNENASELIRVSQAVDYKKLVAY